MNAAPWEKARRSMGEVWRAGISFLRTAGGLGFRSKLSSTPDAILGLDPRTHTAVEGLKGTYQSSLYRSRQSGLTLSISSIFHL